jgi:hypothetical protein
VTVMQCAPVGKWAYLNAKRCKRSMEVAN